MLVEQYPVGWAVDFGKPEPVMAYLIDVPGIAMQGRTLTEAVAKLQAFAPTVLAVYRKEGTLPAPSPEPGMTVGGVQLERHQPILATQSMHIPAAVEVNDELQLAPA
jgi:predicted RNase H-like HicB family nuclease